jgi:hypothetical protein
MLQGRAASVFRLIKSQVSAGWISRDEFATIDRRELRYRLRLCLPVYAAWLLTYESVGHWARRLAPHEIATAWDMHIPFWPQWIWVYGLTYVVPFAALLWVRERAHFQRALVAIGLASVGAYAVFLLWPVAAPQPTLGSSLADRLLALQYRYDRGSGANQLPSLHVAIAWILFAAISGNDRAHWRARIAGCVALAISLSTLFVKQHLIADVFTGVVTAGAAYWVAGRLWEAYVADRAPSRKRTLRHATSSRLR